MPVRTNIAPEDGLSIDAHGRVTNNETAPFSAIPFCATSFSATASSHTDLNAKPFSALSAQVESCDNNIKLNLSETDQKSLDSIFQTSLNLNGREWSHYFNLKPLLWVILGHGLLLLLLIFLWRTQSEQLGLSFTESSVNAGTATKALKAYFIYAPSTQTAPVDSAQNIAMKDYDVSSDPIISPPNTVKQTADVEPVTKVIPKLAETPTAKPMEQIAKLPEVSAAKSSTLAPNTSTQGQTQQSTKEAVKPTSSAKGRNSIQAAKTQLSAADEQSGGISGSVGLFTQRYFERQREQALDDLVLEQANHYSKRSNLSEMSPEMEVLIVPNAEDFSGPTSLDLELDPNRIVRQGDTCYRVVKVGTPINPYAENLGFPFDCSGKKMNQEIDDAIKAQLNKMMVKRPKG